MTNVNLTGDPGEFYLISALTVADFHVQYRDSRGQVITEVLEIKLDDKIIQRHRPIFRALLLTREIEHLDVPISSCG